MMKLARLSTSILRRCLPQQAFGLALICALTMIAQAQTFSVLHTFNGESDGANPTAALTIGGSSTLYGTTWSGGAHEDGIVFKLSQRNSSWTLDPLYEFQGTNDDGAHPFAGITIGTNGALYGTTYEGGSSTLGTIFELQPPATACKTSICYFNETVLHIFQGILPDGGNPYFGNLIFDQAGDFYGTTLNYGRGYHGIVFEFSPYNGGYAESIPHAFINDGSDGLDPAGGVILDTAGNLYGTTGEGGISTTCDYGCGTVFQLVPAGDGNWTENILHNFANNSDGAYPSDTPIMDQSGNLYGTTEQGGAFNQGTIFRLSPAGGGSWSYTQLYIFSECQPYAGLTFDTSGNLYGVCVQGGADGKGFVFKLANSGGTWTFTDLYDFTGGADGGNPEGGVTFDSSGNLYGTTTYYGNNSCSDFGCGTVWEITP